MLWTILWWVAVVLFSLGALILIIFGVFILAGRYQVEKFMFGLPWLKWLKIEDLPQFGLSKSWGHILLPLFNEKGYLETRLIDEDDMDEYEHELVDKFGFSIATADLYEFKLTKRKNRKEKWSLSFKDLTPIWQPARI